MKTKTPTFKTLATRAASLGLTLSKADESTVRNEYAKGCPVRVRWQLSNGTRSSTVGFGVLADVEFFLDELEFKSDR